jgi:glycosyltransferase involved in cell wall biosynthesis
LIGDGPLRAELEALTADLNLTDRVRFLGSRDDVAALLVAADVAVLSSRSEGLSLALLEAMAAGKPVVATRVGGNPEVLTDGETGRLVPPADPEALAAALLEVLDQPGQAAALGRAARSRVVERFSLRGMVTQYEQVYERLLHDT